MTGGEARRSFSSTPRSSRHCCPSSAFSEIEAGIARLCEKFGEEWLFVGPPRAQATEQYFRWPELVPVTDATSAQRAIDEILEQGEGLRGRWQTAHFGQFVAILDEFEQLREVNRAFDPARPVIAANVSLPAPGGVRVIAVQTAAELLDACEARFDAADVLLMAAAVSGRKT